MNREEIIRIAIGTAQENGNFRRCFLTDQDLEKIADIAYAAGAAAEREACAQISEAFDKERPQSNYGRCLAVAIRARGQK